jgi:hypothetical protein
LFALVNSIPKGGRKTAVVTKKDYSSYNMRLRPIAPEVLAGLAPHVISPWSFFGFLGAYLQ